MQEEMLTLEKFEEVSEIVKKVALETKQIGRASCRERVFPLV